MSPPAASPLDDASLATHLRARGILTAALEVEVEAAGDGNINWVRRARVRGSGASWIVKQARPALERFPEYQASTERIVFEERWFAIARPLDVHGVCPRILDFDEASRTLVLEDLGDAERLDRALARGADVAAPLRLVVELLAAVHVATHDPALAQRFRNDDMRTLHGQHVFCLPFAANDFPLEPQLRRRAERVWQDVELTTIAAAAYRRYGESRGALLHGDVQAGNILLPADGGAKLLDAEIAHVGDPAFDVGSLLAHLLLAGLARDALVQAAELGAATWSAYARIAGADEAPFADAARYAGIEVMRRTIGAARVAAVQDTAVALVAVDLAALLMRRPPSSVDAFVTELRAFAR